MVSQVRDLYGLPKLEGLPRRGDSGGIRVSEHQVNRHPDFAITGLVYQHFYLDEPYKRLDTISCLPTIY